ncbi:MAG: hypothetical protein HN509_18610 [Halobacteriovoraceae bacterium]|nr:hypothetical protein [Halobacteriovoraceae bacterium]
MSYRVGSGSADITANVPEIVMLGYGNPGNFVEGVETPLRVRVFYFKNSNGQELIFANFEICFITQILRETILDFLKGLSNSNWRDANVILTAQHTHSAPSGYTHYALYNMPTPGFCQQVLDTLVDGFKEAFASAKENSVAAKVLYKAAEFPPEIPVAYNRSMSAYKRNNEVAGKRLRIEDQNLCVDRTMRALHIVSESGPVGFINWFAVHCTSVMWTNRLISPDNKGYASLEMEQFVRKESGAGNFEAIFAQGNAGDVSPLYQVPKWKRYLPRDVSDDFAKARHNGHLQFEQALKIFKNSGEELSGDIDSEFLYVDMSCQKVDPEFLPKRYKRRNITTSPACLGVAFLKGAENAGIDFFIAYPAILISYIIMWFEIFVTSILNAKMAQAVRKKYKSQAPKAIFVESGARRIWGTRKVVGLVLPGAVDPTIKYFKRLARRNALGKKSWTQQVLPAQVTVMGSLCLVMLPAETSTMAGERIAKYVAKMLKRNGVKHVVLSPYANGYSGYIVTPEEYSAQCYEGGHCVFGRWTLPAWLTVLKGICEEMQKAPDQRSMDRSLRPPTFTNEEISKRSFVAHGY